MYDFEEVKVGKINTLVLSDEQEEAITEVFDIYSGGDQYAQISGAAGTGKTTLALELIDRANLDGYKCHLTAPTNKAAKILSEKTGRKAVTIHKLLQLVLEDHEDTQKLSKGGAFQVEDGQSTIVIIDEASMLGKDLMELIHSSVNNCPPLRMLFLGDPYQLNPIGEDFSEALDYSGFELKTVMRQAAENPIIQLAHSIREAQVANDGRRIDWHSFADGKNIIIHDKARAFIDHYIEAFKAGEDTHLVAWRNEKVNQMNDYVREQLYGAKAREFPFLEDEEVMLYSPVFKAGPSGNKITVLANSALANVVSIEKTTQSVSGNTFDCWDIWLQPDDLVENEVQVFVPCDLVQFAKDLQEVANRAKKLEGRERAWIWHEYYYPIKNHFTQMRPSHAMTSHKSQGSTFHSVYVNVQDIQLNRNNMEMLRSLYVAVTRGAVKLHLYGCGRKR